MNRNDLDKGFYIAGWICIGLLMAYVLFTKATGMQLLNIFPPCAFHAVTGLYCPGCGGTRAAFAFCRGHVLTSFLLHPFVPFVGILGIWFMITQTIERLCKKQLKWTLHYSNALLWGALAIVVINFLLRNAIYIFTGITILH